MQSKTKQVPKEAFVVDTSYPVLELVGQPGAGKTYTAERLVTETDFRLVEVRSRWQRRMLSVMFILRHPIVFIRFFSILCRYAKNTTWRLFWHKLTQVLFPAGALEMLVKNKTNVILDQGLLQVFIGLFDYSVDHATLSREWSRVSAYFKGRQIYILKVDEETQQ